MLANEQCVRPNLRLERWGRAPPRNPDRHNPDLLTLTPLDSPAEHGTASSRRRSTDEDVPSIGGTFVEAKEASRPSPPRCARSNLRQRLSVEFVEQTRNLPAGASTPASASRAEWNRSSPVFRQRPRLPTTPNALCRREQTRQRADRGGTAGDLARQPPRVCDERHRISTRVRRARRLRPDAPTRRRRRQAELVRTMVTIVRLCSPRDGEMLAARTTALALSIPARVVNRCSPRSLRRTRPRRPRDSRRRGRRRDRQGEDGARGGDARGDCDEDVRRAWCDTWTRRTRGI